VYQLAHRRTRRSPFRRIPTITPSPGVERNYQQQASYSPGAHVWEATGDCGCHGNSRRHCACAIAAEKSHAVRVELHKDSPRRTAEHCSQIIITGRKPGQAKLSVDTALGCRAEKNETNYCCQLLANVIA